MELQAPLQDVGRVLLTHPFFVGQWLVPKDIIEILAIFGKHGRVQQWTIFVHTALPLLLVQLFISTVLPVSVLVGFFKPILVSG
jgi:hypothetical protein